MGSIHPTFSTKRTTALKEDWQHGMSGANIIKSVSEERGKKHLYENE